MDNTAKNFALQLGSLVALYISVSALLVTLFGVITLAFPADADSYWRVNSATESIRFAISALVVFFPTYIVLTRMVNNIRRKEHGAYLTLTKWLIYLTLLAGGAVLLGDLVAVINGFLDGELTIRFFLKALSMFVIVGAAFLYYLFDVKGYWQDHDKKSIQYGMGAIVLVIIVVVLGFFHIEAPSEVRERKIDDEQVRDLRGIQQDIEAYYELREMLPKRLSDLYIEGLTQSEAAEGRSDYQYSILDSESYELCAEFAYPSEETSKYAEPMYVEYDGVMRHSVTWDHGAGNWCFERKVKSES